MDQLLSDGKDFCLYDNYNQTNSNYNNIDHSYEIYGKKCAMYFYVKDYKFYQIELE